MKSIFSSRRNKSPHNNEEAEKKEAPFFSKENKAPFFNSPEGTVQTKLTIGQPNDKYEREADSMADAVVNNKASKPDIQNKEISSIQRESLATPQEDEKLDTAERRMEEDKLVQEKPEIQKMGVEEEEEGMVSMMEGEKEEEEEVQTKSNGNAQTASTGLTQQLKSKSGRGKGLPQNTKAEMESSFGRDFSEVNIHTDEDAVKMNKELGAQAFTHGNDIYFNSGKYLPESGEGKHLLAHELTHVVQQNSSINMKKKKKAKRDPRIASCLKKKSGDILPGKVGLLEHINRDVGLAPLGKEKASFEKKIRGNREAHRFVCEYGVSAVLALYHNKDFKNRLDVVKARESHKVNPEYYTYEGSDKRQQTIGMLEKKYRISIKKGNKDWSPHDVILLAESLGTLNKKEIPLIQGYNFIRWSDKCRHELSKNPDYNCLLEDYSICGIEQQDIVHGNHTITMYDCGITGSREEHKNAKFNVRPGSENIIHEIGHAMEHGDLRLANDKVRIAKKEMERLQKQLKKAQSTSEKASIERKLQKAVKAMAEAKKAQSNAGSSGGIETFKKLTRGRKPLSEYSKENDREAFAEAFMFYKVAPKMLKKKNKKLFNWFKKGGFI